MSVFARTTLLEFQHRVLEDTEKRSLPPLCPLNLCADLYWENGGWTAIRQGNGRAVKPPRKETWEQK